MILRFEGVPEIRERLKQRFLHADRSGDELVATELTRLECRVLPLRAGDQALLDLYEGFFSGREVSMLPVRRDAWDLAAEVRARHGLKTPDALHVACAVTLGCDLLITGDARMARCPEVKTELVVP